MASARCADQEMGGSVEVPNAVSSVQQTSLARPNAFPAVVRLLVALGVALLYLPTTKTLIAEWEDVDKTTYTHGYLIAVLSIWLILRNRDDIGGLRWDISWRAALMLCGAGLTWLVAMRSGIQIVHQMLLPALMWLAVYALFGWHGARRCWFAIAYLYFAIPLWDHINALLQSATVVAVGLLLRLTGVPAYIDGNFVHLSAGAFEIAGGCSGLHFFIVSVAIGALYGEIGRDSTRVRLLLLSLAATLGLVTNWLRVYSIILAGYLTDMQHYLVSVEHYRFGWLVFAVSMIAFFLVARRVPSSATLQEVTIPRVQSRVPLTAGVVLVAVSLILGPLVHASTSKPSDSLSRFPTFPTDPGVWSGPRSLNTAWRPSFVGADHVEHVLYSAGDIGAEAFSAVYAYQEQGKELVGFDNSLFAGLNPISTTKLEDFGGVIETVVEDANSERYLLWHYYQVGEWRTTRTISAQLAYGLGTLISPQPSRIVALRIRCESDCTDTRAALHDLLLAFDRSSSFVLKRVEDTRS